MEEVKRRTLNCFLENVLVREGAFDKLEVVEVKYTMNYKFIWKTALIIVIVISAIMVAPSLFRMYELPDSMIHILGIADIIVLFVLVFSFVKSNKKH